MAFHYFKINQSDDSILEYKQFKYEQYDYNTKEDAAINGKPYIVPVTIVDPGADLNVYKAAGFVDAYDGNTATRTYQYVAKSNTDIYPGVVTSIKDEGKNRILTIFDSAESLEQIKTIFDSIVPAARSDSLSNAIQIYQYAKSQVDWAKGANVSSLLSYNAATDPGWPS